MKIASLFMSVVLFIGSVFGTVREIFKIPPTGDPGTVTTYSKKSLGTFRITCYTPYSDNGAWGYATATGVRSKHLATCAVDPNVIPLGSVIEVNGLTLLAVDVGGGVKGKIIDVFFDGTEAQARKWLDGFGEKHEVFLG